MRDRRVLVDLGRDEFVEQMVENLTEKPSNYETIIGIKTGREGYPADGEATQLETGANSCTA